MNLNQAKDKLSKYGQEHILNFFNELNQEEQNILLNQIKEIDCSVLNLINEKDSSTKGIISPIEVMQLNEIQGKQELFNEIGLKTIKEGKVGTVLLAGGMGTRLGSDNPKGMYNIGETKDVFIFQRIIENLLDVVNISKTWIHLFIMTSDKNNDITIDFFKEHNYFGYNKDYIYFFKQEVLPTCDFNGKIYMENKFKMATSPNGNGGWLSSMNNVGIIDIIKKNNIEWLNVFSVDNVLQRIADPIFIGATINGGYVCGSKVVKKASINEKVGVICLEDEKPSVVEYYELTNELMFSKNDKGEYSYNFGVILNYLLNTTALFKLIENNMPLHIVEKKIPFINESGDEVNPSVPNGYKFETLILDMVHLLDNCLPFEVDRNKEFAPIKNKTGIDSVESAKKLLKENGIEI